jgi:hypothetical protein
LSFSFDDVSSHGVTLIFNNKEKLEVVFKPDFEVLQKEGDHWEAVTFVEDIYVPLMIMQSLPYIEDGYLDFDQYYGGLPPGEYRFIQDIYLADDLADANREGRTARPSARIFTDFEVLYS